MILLLAAEADSHTGTWRIHHLNIVAEILLQYSVIRCTINLRRCKK